jgi:tetratricopeptide (TPR) repeat protein
LRFVTLTALFCICFVVENLSAGENLNKLRELYHQGMYDEALLIVPEALVEATRADSAEVFFYEASVERIAELAEIKMMEVARRFPESPFAERALLRSAIYQYEIDNPARSEYLLRKILKDYMLTPIEPEIRLWLGKNYIMRGEYRSARVELRHGINSLPDFPQTSPWIEGELHYWLGEACKKAGDNRCAQEAFLHVALLDAEDPLSVIAMDNLSLLMAEGGMDEEAELWEERYRDRAEGTMLEKANRRSVQEERPATTVEREEDRSDPQAQEWLWVQVGSFSSNANAENLKEMLVEKGFEPEVKRARMEGRNYYRVRIGPFEEREKALEMLRRLREVGVDGRVMHGY